MDGKKIGIAICEDFWRGFDANVSAMYELNPIDRLIDDGCTILISPCASPFVTGKRETHVQYALELAKDREVTSCNVQSGWRER